MIIRLMKNNIDNIPKSKMELLVNKINNYREKQQKYNAEFIQLELKSRCINILPEQGFFYSFPSPGNIKNVSFCSFPLKPPGSEEVQIKARAISLNFRDLMIGLGIYSSVPDMPCHMGSDYAGVVTKCGSKVKQFQVGDEVIAIHKGNVTHPEHFSSHINVPHLAVVHKPTNITFEEAASIPTVFLTAYYGLYYKAQLSKGKKVLIHSATGGVGLAAIEISKWCQAEIFATAGNVEKRDYLKSRGILYPMNSRTLDFADEVLNMTGGKGIDVILNTLPDEGLKKGLDILKPLGTFIQLEKNNVYNNTKLELGVFKKGLTFSMVDIVLFLENPKLLNKLLSEIVHLFRTEDFRPLPFKSFPIWKVVDALSYMSESKHIGKIVFNLA